MSADTAPITLTPLPPRAPLRTAITALTRRPEPALLPGLLDQARLPPAAAEAAEALALRLARGVRERQRAGGRAGLVQGLLQEFALSSQEGVALMCLAEALLRIPDAATRDALIRDKVGAGNWQAHLGRSPSLFVNAAAWGLLLTGKLVATHSDQGLSATLRRIVGRGGEPLVRKGVDMAMRLMGEQFVTGQTIDEALARGRAREAQGFRHSYDMLGEAAMTAEDAARYLQAYEQAIAAIGAHSAGRGLCAGPGISIKLSALHPRYARAQHERVMAELYPRLRQLALQARKHDIGLNIDAEESERLELSLDLLERLCHEPALAGWHGIGFVVQAYQKRCPAVIDWLVDLARRSGHRLMLRLVKGAYWDSEIKRAQQDGLDGYPVYTRKDHTDVAYLACARRLLAAPDAVYAQFATHNAHSVAAIVQLAGADAPPERYEFQCLHGMGEPLYEQVVAAVAAGGLGRPCRIYAPVGTHDTLLAYLVRRLLENGANTSFVHRLADEAVPLHELVRDPVRSVAGRDPVRSVAGRATGADDIGTPHPAIALPRALYGAARAGARGLDLACETTLAALAEAFATHAGAVWTAAPLLAEPDAPAATPAATLAFRPVHNPADRRDAVGQVRDASLAELDRSLGHATEAAPAWAATPATERAACLEAAADRLEADTARLLTLLVREAGKTCANAVAEVREAVDFLRYYALQLRRGFDNARHRPLGPVACISPWNFPLAIFTGQVAAALAAGNTVLAKPAEQTPLVAAEAVRALWAAGVPRGALQLLPGPGETVGAALVADARVQGVLFTGSTEVARLLQRTLAQRLGAHGQPVPLVAETGGQNAMLVDSSALAEQVVADVLASAFDSAGQRCSALRVLCVQADAAPRLLAMLEGALAEWRLGDPRALATDIGPVIDAAARAAIEDHLAAMQARGRRVVRAAVAEPAALAQGHFVPPALVEIGHLGELQREVFGPVLHVLRYEREDLPAVLAQVNATGYGLTLGVHSRIDETVAQVLATAQAGNVYINRNMVGAVVGVQPFGGEGLSGTGPKAGGPLTLLRLLAAAPPEAARCAVLAEGEAARSPVRGLALPGLAAPAMPAAAPADTDTAPGHRSTGATEAGPAAPPPALAALLAWARADGRDALAAAGERLGAASPAGLWRSLRGPTGQADLYGTLPREAVLCLVGRGDAGAEHRPGAEADRLAQLAAVLAVGARALWPAAAAALAARLPAPVRERITLAADWRAAAVHAEVALHHGTADERLAIAAALAAVDGPLTTLLALASGDAAVPLLPLLRERAISINTAAAGGNATLMALA